MNLLIIIIPFFLLYFNITINQIIIGHIIAQFFTVLYNFKNVINYDSLFLIKVRKYLKWKYLINTGRKNSKFSLIESFGAFVDNCTIAFIVFSIGIIGTNIDVANYHYAYKLLSFPLAIIISPLSQILIPELSQLINNKNDIKEYILKIIMITSFVGLIIYILLYVFNVELINVLYGNGWEFSSYVLKIFSLTSLVIFIVSPMSVILLIRKKFYLNTGWKFFRLITFIFIFFLLNNGDLYTFLLYIAIIDIVLYILYSIIIFKTFKSCAE